MHVFNDGGWFTGEQGLNCCKRMYSAAFTINCAI